MNKNEFEVPQYLKDQYKEFAEFIVKNNCKRKGEENGKR